MTWRVESAKDMVVETSQVRKINRGKIERGGKREEPEATLVPIYLQVQAPPEFRDRL